MPGLVALSSPATTANAVDSNTRMSLRVIGFSVDGGRVDGNDKCDAQATDDFRQLRGKPQRLDEEIPVKHPEVQLRRTTVGRNNLAQRFAKLRKELRAIHELRRKIPAVIVADE